ncbi:hypothetical protein D3C72_1707930 [compost metagenome]
MWIFFCFGNSDLGFPSRLQHFAHCFLKDVLIENNFYILERFIVICKRYIIKIQGFHSVLREIVLRQNFCDFTSSVSPEIERNYNVVVLNLANRKMVLNRNNRLDKLIRYIFVIRILNRLYKIFGFFPNAVYHQVISQFHTLPTSVSVHRVVATN